MPSTVRDPRNTHLVFPPRSNPSGGSRRFWKLLIKKPTDKIVVPKAFLLAYYIQIAISSASGYKFGDSYSSMLKQSLSLRIACTKL